MSSLPPCRICGKKASGTHFGVNTCEACKAFFRRSLSKFEKFSCNQNKTCELPPGNRNFCSYCRFKKCVTLGMCREAIKTGRYTHAKRANDIRELKGISRWSAPEAEQPDVLQERLLKIQSEYQLLVEQPELNKYRKSTNGETKQQLKTNSWTSEISEAEGGSGRSQASVVAASESNDIDIDLDPVSSVSSWMSCSALQLPIDDTDLIEKTISVICETYKACSPWTPQFRESIPRLQDEYIKLREAKKEVFGSMKTISRDEYLSVYEATGLDVDCRREMLVIALPHIEGSIKRMICFLKEIPGLGDLTTEELICLTKKSFFYCWILINRHSFNHGLQVHVGADGGIVGKEDMTKYLDQEWVQALFDVNKKIHDLGLSDEEASIFAALCVLSSENDEQRIEVTSKNQELILKCLQYLFEKHHPEDKMRLPKFIDCFLFMKSRISLFSQIEKQIIRDWDGAVKFPQFLHELWTTYSAYSV